MRSRLIMAFLILGTVNIQAQDVLNHLFGVVNDQNGDYWFMSPDISTSAITNIGGALPIASHYSTASTINRNQSSYYIGVLDTAAVKRLYEISMEDGTIISSPNLDFTTANGQLEFQYNNGNNKLYGLNLQSGNDNANIIEINKSTGAYSLIKTVSPVNSKTNGSSTIDEINNRYFFNAADEFGDFKLYVVGLDSGVILSQPGYSGSLASPPLEMEYDAVENKLYGLTRDDNGIYHFSRISMTNALVTNMSTIGGLAGTFSGSSTFDPIGRRYFVNGFDTDSKKRLYVIDVTDGSVISKVEYATNPFSYSMDLEYMFHGIIGIKENAVLPLQVYPNPSNENVWFNIPFNGSLELQVYDMLGKTILTENYNRAGVNKFDVSSFPAGIYNIRAIAEGKVYSGLVVVN